MRIVFAFIALLPLASAADPLPETLLFVGDLQWVKRYPNGYRQLAPPGTSEEELDSVAVSFGCGDEEAHFSVVTPLIGPRLTEASIISPINEFCEPAFYVGLKRAAV